MANLIDNSLSRAFVWNSAGAFARQSSETDAAPVMAATQDKSAGVIVSLSHPGQALAAKLHTACSTKESAGFSGIRQAGTKKGVGGKDTETPLYLRGQNASQRQMRISERSGEMKAIQKKMLEPEGRGGKAWLELKQKLDQMAVEDIDDQIEQTKVDISMRQDVMDAARAPETENRHEEKTEIGKTDKTEETGREESSATAEKSSEKPGAVQKHDEESKTENRGPGKH